MKRFLLTFFLTVSALAEPYYYLKRTYLNVEDMDLGECERTYRFLNGNYADCMMTLKGSHELSQISYLGIGVQSWSEMTDIPGIEVSLMFSPHQPNSRSMSEGMTFHVTFHFNKIGSRGYLETVDAWRFQHYFFAKHIQKALAHFSDKEVYYSTPIVSLLSENPRNFRDEVIGRVRVGERTSKYLLSECHKTFVVEMEDYGEGWFSGCSLVPITESHMHREGIPLTPEFWSTKIHRSPEYITPCDKDFALLVKDSNLSVVTDYRDTYPNRLVKKSFDEIKTCLAGFLENHQGYKEHFIFTGTKLYPGEKASGFLERIFDGRKAILEVL